MNIKSRLAKLESAMAVNAEPTQFAIFFEAPGVKPIGYTCDDVEIIRQPSESIEALQKRCSESVSWPDTPCTLHFFNQCEVLP
jgi:hypothetical protein